MNDVSLLEFRKDAFHCLQKVQKGQRLLLTYRRKPICWLSPYREETVNSKDSFYQLSSHAETGGGKLSNEEMDRLIYEK